MAASRAEGGWPFAHGTTGGGKGGDRGHEEYDVLRHCVQAHGDLSAGWVGGEERHPPEPGKPAGSDQPGHGGDLLEEVDEVEALGGRARSDHSRCFGDGPGAAQDGEPCGGEEPRRWKLWHIWRRRPLRR